MDLDDPAVFREAFLSSRTSYRMTYISLVGAGDDTPVKADKRLIVR